MKTWEIYKMALENPNLRVKSINGKIYKPSTTKGKFMEIGNPAASTICLVPAFDDEFEIVQEPVYFMAAINSGKRFKHENWDNYHYLSEVLFILSQRHSTVALNAIKGKKWYIEQ